MANRIATKSRPGSKTFIFGAIQSLPFEPPVTIVSQGNTIVQDYLVLPFACKIVLVSVAATSSASGVTAFNIVIGSAAEGGALVADNSDVGALSLNTAPGLSLFQNAGNTAPLDKTVTLVAYVGQTFATSEPDAVFPQGTVLTFRYTSGASVAGSFKAFLAVVPVDIKPGNPTFAAFSWTNDVG